MHVLLIPTAAVHVPENSIIVDLATRFGGTSKAMHRVIFLGSSHHAAGHVDLGVACPQCRTLMPRQFTESCSGVYPVRGKWRVYVINLLTFNLCAMPPCFLLVVTIYSHYIAGRG